VTQQLNQEAAPLEGLAPSRLTTPRAAAVAGLVFAVLFVVSVLALRLFVDPSATGLAAELVGDWVSIVPAYLVPFAGIAFLWFIAVVRDRIGVYEGRFFSTVFLGSGFVFVAMLFSASSVVAGLLTLAQPLESTTALGQAIARGMFYIYGARSAGVFTIVASMIVLRTGALRRWAALLGVGIGVVLLLSAGSFDMVILLFPVWVALVSVLVLVPQGKSRASGNQ